MNQIINDDCNNAIKSIQDNSVDLICFSPPYDEIRDYGGNSNFDIDGLGKELFRVLKDGGVCCVVIQDGTKNFAKSLTTFSLAVNWVKQIGFKLFECCIYSRHGKPGAWWSKRFRVDHEYILIFFKGDKPKYFNKESLKIPAKHAGAKWHGTQRKTDGSLDKIEEKVQQDTKCPGTIWEYASSNTEGNKEKLKHPATYPDKLVQDLISCFTQEDDIVLDPMCGSGTTCVMAKNLNRKYIGIEINKEYYDICLNRLNAETNNSIKSMFEE